MIKYCRRCETDKESTEFYKDKYRPDGLALYCKSCQTKYSEKSEEQKAHARKKALDYYHENKDNEEYMLARHKYEISGRKNKDERAEKHKLWRLDHPDYQKEQYHKDPERYRQYARKSRDKKPRTPHGKPGSVRYEARMAGFRSGFERTLDVQLKQSGIVYEYESLKIPYTIAGNYNPDWTLENGIILEAKGVLDRQSKQKMVAVKRQHPELDIRFVFMDSDKRIPGGKQTHGEWAKRHGFPFASGRIPDEWLNS